MVRRFFADHRVLEVETPLLAHGTATDLHIASLETTLHAGGDERRLYLQTSPELAMRRLLAAGSGPIFQLGRAFRDDPRSRLHNPEFTMLEWYRPGFDHHDLMDETSALLAMVLGTKGDERLTYAEAFVRHAGVDPHRASTADLVVSARRAGIDVVGLGEADRDGWLHLLNSHLVEPQLGRGRPTMIHDFPASQASLARVVECDGVEVAERFEVYVEGVELANGYHELTDVQEQRRRFANDLRARARAGLPVPPIDERFLAALEAGMPRCAGIALGIDRLVMLARDATHIDQVLTFPVERA